MKKPLCGRSGERRERPEGGGPHTEASEGYLVLLVLTRDLEHYTVTGLFGLAPIPCTDRPEISGDTFGSRPRTFHCTCYSLQSPPRALWAGFGLVYLTQTNPPSPRLSSVHFGSVRIADWRGGSLTTLCVGLVHNIQPNHINYYWRLLD